MTTEIWIPGFKNETILTIPNNKSLNPSQKSNLIKNLHLYNPPSPRLDYTEISPNQLGQIVDKDKSTIISTRSIMKIGTYDLDKDSFLIGFPIHKRSCPWISPVTISGKNNEVASIHLPGYGNKRIPIFVQNISK